ncbi:MAG: hypothetical protein P4L57_13545, partial [Rhizomicrobium sp.]|nr:hypothetical protein [Rhizomicrobium sp.]
GIGKMLLEIARFRASIRPNPAKSNTCRRTEKSNGATHSVFLTDDYIESEPCRQRIDLALRTNVGPVSNCLPQINRSICYRIARWRTLRLFEKGSSIRVMDRHIIKVLEGNMLAIWRFQKVMA